jgi:hypothetical protein
VIEPTAYGGVERDFYGYFFKPLLSMMDGRMIGIWRIRWKALNP